MHGTASSSLGCDLCLYVKLETAMKNVRRYGTIAMRYYGKGQFSLNIKENQYPEYQINITEL